MKPTAHDDQESRGTTDLPARPLPEDAVDAAARVVAAEIALHLELMYPDAPRAVAWSSCKRSLSGVVRNSMSRLGRAAEKGEMNAVIKDMQRERARRRKLHS